MMLAFFAVNPDYVFFYIQLTDVYTLAWLQQIRASVLTTAG